jgi:hypothetical protein
VTRPSFERYRRPKRRYEEKSDGFVLNKVKLVGQIGQGLVELGEEVKTSQMDAMNTLDHVLNLFLGRHNLGIPESKRWVGFDSKSAKTSDIIFRMMGMLTGDIRFQYVVPQGARREESADEIEQHLNGYPKWLFKKYQTRWDLQALFWQLLAGRSYLQQTYLPFYWDKTELKRKDGEDDAAYNERVEGYRGFMGPPVFVESLDPRIVFPIMTPMGPEAYIKKYRVQRFEMDEAFRKVGVQVVTDRYGTVSDVIDLRKRPGIEVPEQTSDTSSNAIDYWEYIDDEMCYYVVGNRVVYRYAHGGGLKIFPAYGLQTGLKEFAFMAMGVLWPVRNEIPQYDFLRTLWMNKAYLDVFPQLIAQLAETENPLTDESGNPKEWEIEPGTVKQIRGQLINAMKDAASGVDFRALIEMVAGDIDLATIPNLARGFAGAQQPGYSINQLSQSMRTQWRPIIESRELQYGGMAEHYLYTVKNVVGAEVSYFTSIEEQETGRIHGRYVAVAPDDIHDFCQVIAHLNPELPIDRQGNMLAMANLHERGMLPWEQYVRDGLEKTNPEQVRRQVQRDSALRAFLPAAIEDAMALGRVKLTNDIIRERGLDRLNSIGNLDIQALKAARAQGKASAISANAAGNQPAPMAPGPPTGGPPGELGPEPQNAAAGPPPTVGANPVNPTPGYRGP